MINFLSKIVHFLSDSVHLSFSYTPNKLAKLDADIEGFTTRIDRPSVRSSMKRTPRELRLRIALKIVLLQVAEKLSTALQPVLVKSRNLRMQGECPFYCRHLHSCYYK
jgi:hypothetical protein